MAEEKSKKPSWHFPGAGRGTWSGFFVAWVFVAGVIGITVVLMLLGKGPMPLRVVGYDLGLENADPAKVDFTKLASAIKQTNFMVLVIQGTSEKLTGELSRKLEVKKENVISEGSAAILSKYPIERSEKTGIPVIRFGENGRFGIVSLDLRGQAENAQILELSEARDRTRRTFGERPHAIMVLVEVAKAAMMRDYAEAPAKNQEESDWRILIPERVGGALKESYVPVDNKSIKNPSGRLPIVAHFVFHKADFQ